MVRQLPPWFENLGMRQAKAPQVYVRDPGLLHALLALDGFAALGGHPRLGTFWEGFALEQALRHTGDRDAYFWGTHAGAELDLLVTLRGKRHGFEFKYGDAPNIQHPTSNMEHRSVAWVCVLGFHDQFAGEGKGQACQPQ